MKFDIVDTYFILFIVCIFVGMIRCAITYGSVNEAFERVRHTYMDEFDSSKMTIKKLYPTLYKRFYKDPLYSYSNVNGWELFKGVIIPVTLVYIASALVIPLFVFYPCMLTLLYCMVRFFYIMDYGDKNLYILNFKKDVVQALIQLDKMRTFHDI